MKVVITGVAGFLGSHLADAFLERGWNVTGIDNLLGGYYDNVPKEVDFWHVDLLDLDEIQIPFFEADLVIHAACTAYEGLSVFSPSLIVANTVQATTNTLTAAINAKVKKFVYLSSMARYGEHEGRKYQETFETKPQDPYGIAKVASENLVRNLCDTHGLEWVILVPHNIIGPKQKYDDPYRNVASIMINRMLQDKQPIIYGDGSQQRCFSYIDDVVDPLIAACVRPEAIGEVINIGPDETTMPIKELAERIAHLLGKPFDPIYMPGRPQEVPIALCSSDKARALLDYQTKVPFQEALIKLIEWIKQRGTKDFTYHLPLEINSELTPATWSKKLM